MITNREIVNLAQNQLSEAQFLLLGFIPEDLSQKLFDLCAEINHAGSEEIHNTLAPGVVRLILRYHNLDFFEFRQWYMAKGKEIKRGCFYNADVSEYIKEHA